jgi:hypothetical protein
MEASTGEPRSPGARASTALLAAAWIGATAVLGAWLASSSPGDLRLQLRSLQFWSLEAAFVALVVLTLVATPRLWRSLDLRARDALFPTAVSLLTLVLATLVAPQTNRIYYDEQIYQSIGQNFSDLRLAQMCNDGTVEYGSLQCWRGEYNKEPYAFPYLIGVAYRIAGVDERVAAAVNPVLAALTVWVVFLIATTVTGRPEAGQLAAVVMALMPEHLRWSHTTAAEPAAAFGGAIAVLAALAFARQRTTSALIWTTAATAFGSQMRPEGLLVGAVVAAIILTSAPRELGTRRVWTAALAGFVLIAVHIAHLVAVRHEGWGASGPRFAAMFLPGNLDVNGGFFLGDSRFPVLYTGLAIAGILLARPRRLTAVMVLYFACFWGVFLFFYAGSYNYGADDRFSLLTFPAVAVLAGMGALAIVEALARRTPLTTGRIRAGVIAVVAVSFTWYLPFVRAIGEEAWGARADVAFARDFVADLPPNSYVLTHNPNMFHVWGINAGQSSLASSDTGYLTEILSLRYAGGLYFHWNFWCNVADPVQQSFCAGILSRFPHQIVRESRERGYRYALYRLDVSRQGSSSK